jgi:hypothetical protein
VIFLNNSEELILCPCPLNPPVSMLVAVKLAVKT